VELGLASLEEGEEGLGDCVESWRGESTGDGSSSRMEIRDGEVGEVGSVMVGDGNRQGWRSGRYVMELLRCIGMELNIYLG
jgi:hypothetical protein